MISRIINYKKYINGKILIRVNIIIKIYLSLKINIYFYTKNIDFFFFDKIGLLRCKRRESIMRFLKNVL